MQIEGVVKKMH